MNFIFLINAITLGGMHFLFIEYLVN